MMPHNEATLIVNFVNYQPTERKIFGFSDIFRKKRPGPTEPCSLRSKGFAIHYSFHVSWRYPVLFKILMLKPSIRLFRTKRQDKIMHNDVIPIAKDQNFFNLVRIAYNCPSDTDEYQKSAQVFGDSNRKLI